MNDMNVMLLQEYVDRRGLVTPRELIEQTGAARGLWRGPAIELVQRREIFLCRLHHGHETLLSKHLLFCLRTVYTEPVLTPGGRELYGWICGNEPASRLEIEAGCGLAAGPLDSAFWELQKKLCIAPMAARGEGGAVSENANEFLAGVDFLWVTDMTWLEDLRRPNKYQDLEYCLSEIRRLMKKHFSARELNSLIYHGVL